jgi:hypothetical protein
MQLKNEQGAKTIFCKTDKYLSTEQAGFMCQKAQFLLPVYERIKLPGIENRKEDKIFSNI